MWIRDLSALECSKILASERLAHLACVDGRQPYLVPIYFVYSDHHLYSFSMPGHKIDCMRSNPHICLQVDERGQGPGWKSVIVQGRYQELDVSPELVREREHAWSLLSKHPFWWEPGSLKPIGQAVPRSADHYEHIYFRVLIDSVTGREAKDPGTQVP
ncbi:hypothetical protein MesoLjLc_38910 [Mesorhizobium sp. L-8-10]|uniref:pyridoxamine 5'-phosphate oxidase family protein n=1 Tax=unclassified Mesorhizobium TaxID=325217 RepID=UPI001926E0C2|nr:MULTISPECIES: pyridoxamine 5'-phosphate oxidase family protein [unclassified Mesorhizobium]BCH24227.1 hypothetical protein MesoLjLb_40120 [Mesorhizobium sp. L-8-3]BCH31961.1 hypothetical protein MesoLjLc_38910 [Mesorhizobium sp. L-8-10]